ncbi:hypothetical protein Bca4012_050466 [Brassica carinata]
MKNGQELPDVKASKSLMKDEEEELFTRGQRREEREHEDMWTKGIQRQKGNGKREGTRRMNFFS